MEPNKKLPVYKLKISENDDSPLSVDYVALVDSPAIEIDWLKFLSEEKFIKPHSGESEPDFMNRCMPVLINEGKDMKQAAAICHKYYDGEEEKKTNYKNKFAADTERRLIMGPLMIANMPIYRRDTERGEFFVVFDKDEILKVVKKFFRNGMTSNFNIMHDDNKRLDDVYLIESFIIDSSRGVKAPEAFKNLPEGSWLATVKVDNELVWEQFIKTGELKGFSVEGLFSYERVSDAPQSVLDEIIDIIKNG